MNPADRFIRLPDCVEAFGFDLGAVVPLGIVDSVVAGPDGPPWRDLFAVTSCPIGFTNAVGATIPADVTVADIQAVMKLAPRPEPEHVIITPSIDALIAYTGAVKMDPANHRTLDGIRVVVTKFADRPKLIPAAALDRPPFTVAFEDSAAAQFVRPPIGVAPGWLWREHHPRPSTDDRCDRVVELRGAIRRYVEAGLKPPLEWGAEIEEHAAALQTGFVDAVESFLDQLDAVADSPEPIVVEGQP